MSPLTQDMTKYFTKQSVSGLQVTDWSDAIGWATRATRSQKSKLPFSNTATVGFQSVQEGCLWEGGDLATAPRGVYIRTDFLLISTSSLMVLFHKLLSQKDTGTSDSEGKQSAGPPGTGGR